MPLFVYLFDKQIISGISIPLNYSDFCSIFSNSMGQAPCHFSSFTEIVYPRGSFLLDNIGSQLASSSNQKFY